MNRERAVDLIENVLYGTVSPVGKRLLAQLVEEAGLGCLRDAAVIRLAEMHQQEERRNASRCDLDARRRT